MDRCTAGTSIINTNIYPVSYTHLKTPRIQFFPKLEMRNQAKNVQHVVIRESEAGSAKPSPNPGDLPEAPDSAL